MKIFHKRTCFSSVPGYLQRQMEHFEIGLSFGMIWGEFVGCFYKMFEIEQRQKDTHSKEEPENLKQIYRLQIKR